MSGDEADSAALWSKEPVVRGLTSRTSKIPFICAFVCVASALVAVLVQFSGARESKLPKAADSFAHPKWDGPHTADWRGTARDEWRGTTALRGGKGYASTPMGQVHYRDVGPRDDPNPIVLLHQTPMFMIQWAKVQHELSELGIRSVSVDTPGYGMSDIPPQQPTIQEFADNLVAVLNHLQLGKVVVAGQHTGAQIAAAFAANHPARTSALVMHGAAYFTEEDVARYVGLASANSTRISRTPRPDGLHMSDMFQRWAKDRNTSQELLEAITWMQVSNFLQGPDIGHYAAFRYQMQPDLDRIHVPGLVLSDVTDSLHASDVRLVTDLRPDFRYFEFSGAEADGNFFEQMLQPRRWAEVVAAFVASELGA